MTEKLNFFIGSFLKEKDSVNRSFIQEDSHLENGCYFCTCISCKNVFVGYKLRQICKLCSEKIKLEDNKNG